MKIGFCVLMLGLFTPAAWSQEYCGVDPPTDFREIFQEQLTRLPPPKGISKVVAIPISLNMITNGRQGNYSDAVVATMMNNLNWGYRDTPFQFYVARFRRVNNKKWFQNCTFGTKNHTAMTKKLALDPRHYINVYICNMPEFLGLGSIPGYVFPLNDKRESVLISPKALPLPPGIEDPRFSTYGLVFPHEVGHYLGLFHTFHDGCSDGDFVADTPAQAEPTGYCPESIDSCPEPGRDDVWNFMNYSEDTCMDHFTPGQTFRMIEVVQAFRPGLLQ